MRKVNSCTVIYKSGTNQVYNITISTLDDVLIPLLSYSLNNQYDQPYKYPTFQGMYKTVLHILSNNNFYAGSHDCFGVRVYHINFIELNNPTEIHRYGTAQG